MIYEFNNFHTNMVRLYLFLIKISIPNFFLFLYLYKNEDS